MRAEDTRTPRGGGRDAGAAEPVSRAGGVVGVWRDRWRNDDDC